MPDIDSTKPNEKPPDRRKLIAVLYADMVGYSRLIGLDDVGTLGRLRALRQNLIDPAIDEHGGRIVQTGGDSLLIVFDSIDGAVRCAITVQQQVPIHDRDQPPDRTIRFRGDKETCGSSDVRERRPERRDEAGGERRVRAPEWGAKRTPTPTPTHNPVRRAVAPT